MWKIEVHNASVGVTARELGCGNIPYNLVTLSHAVVALHKANGDLAWLQVVVDEAKTSKYGESNGD